MSTRLPARPSPTPETPPHASEAGSLAREMVSAYQQMATAYREQSGLSPADADAKARERFSPIDEQRLLAKPADQISWWELSLLAEHNPDAAALMWTRIKEEARNELASGHRAAVTMETVSDPWQRAHFLAVRAALLQD